jgi:hypothetical protein
VALALNIIIAIFVVGSLGLVSYEMSRILLAREQLKHCLELASLAGGASMASTSQTGTNAQTQATTIALNILKMNSVLGTSLNGNVIVASSASALNPSPGQTAVYFEFDDPITKAPPVAGGQGNVLRVYGAYAYPLFSGGFGSIGVNTYTLLAEAMAGMPALDLVIVYNPSGSMDDQTNVTLVRRHWDQVTNNNIIYTIPAPGPGGGADGPLTGVVCPGILGSQVNGLPPQNLDAAGDPRTSTCVKEFSEVGPTGSTVPLRGITNLSGPGDAPPGGPPSGGVGPAGLTPGPGYGSQPGAGNVTVLPRPSVPAGPSWSDSVFRTMSEALIPAAQAHYTDPGIIDYETTNPYMANNPIFTDLVVNLDGNQVFGGWTDPAYPGYPFPSLDFLVEAARGNMENGGTAPTAWISNNLNNNAKPGYQNAYKAIAYSKLQPQSTITSAIVNFMNKVSQTSDCHFGFVAFADRAGTSPSDSYSAPTVSWAYSVAGNTTVALPHVVLNPSFNNLSIMTNQLGPAVPMLPMMMPNGGCNLADGLQQAYNDLTSPNTSRSGAMKAIVVITGEVPTRDLAGNKYDQTSNAPALADAMAVASQCNVQGIPIFMVALDQSPNQQLTPYFQTQYSDTANGGLVNTAGHGGALYINNWVNTTTGSTNLNGSLNNVVRQLCKIVQG